MTTLSSTSASEGRWADADVTPKNAPVALDPRNPAILERPDHRPTTCCRLYHDELRTLADAAILASRRRQVDANYLRVLKRGDAAFERAKLEAAARAELDRACPPTLIPTARRP